MAKRFSRINFIVVSVLVAFGLVLSFFSFKMPSSTNNFIGFLNAISLHQDLGKSQTAVYELQPSSDEQTQLTSEQINNTVKLVRETLNINNYSYNSVSISADNKLRIEISKSDVSATILNAFAVPVSIVIRDEETEKVTKRDIDNSHIEEVSPSYQQISDSKYSFGVILKFNSVGKGLLKDLTRHASTSSKKVYFYTAEGQPIGSLDTTKTVSTGVIFVPNESIKTEAAAIEYAVNVQIGLSEAKLKVLENSVNTASVGYKSAAYAAIMFFVALVAMLIFIIIRYRDLGLLAFLSTLIQIILFMLLIQAIPIITVSLAGVIAACLVTALGILAHILIMEKIKTEFKSVKRIPLAFKGGFKNSLFIVLDICALVAIASLLIYIIGAEALKSFGLIMLIGSILTLFCSLVMFRVFANWYLPLNSTKINRLAFTKGETNEK